jgi:YD repeat-containing protein
VGRLHLQLLNHRPRFGSDHTYGTDVTPKQTFVEMRDAAGKRRQSYSDFFGNEVRSILGYGAAEATTTVLAYDVMGRRIQVTDPRGLISRDSVETRGMVRRKSTPDGGTIQHKHDRAGNLRYTQDALQAAAGRVLFTSYDFADRPLTAGIHGGTLNDRTETSA